MGALFTELTQAFRRCCRTPVSSAAAVAVLALGLGFATAYHAVVRGVLLRGLPIEDPQSLVFLGEPAGPGFVTLPMSRLEPTRQSLESVADIAGFYTLFSYLSTDEQTETWIAAFTTQNFFELVGIAPRLGRGFGPQDGQTGAPPVALISERVWRGQFGADPGVLGQVVTINRDPVTIVGVMPEGFGFPLRHDLWISIDPTANHLARSPADLRLFTFARLAPRFALAQARAEVALLAGDGTTTKPDGRDRRLVVQPYVETLTDPELAAGLRFLALASAALLALVATNVGALILGRGLGRRQELAVRSALGAGRWQSLRVLLMEPVLIGAAGGVAGLALARFFLSVFERFRAGIWLRAYWIDIRLDPTVVAASLTLLAGVVLLAGLAPAWRVTKEGQRAFAGGARNTGMGRREGRFHGMLVAAQAALSLALLITGVSMTLALRQLQGAELGFEPDQLAMAQVSIWQLDLANDDVESRLAFFETLLRDLSSEPEVHEVTLADARPAGSSNWRAIARPGETYDDPDDIPLSRVVVAEEHFFNTLGVGLLRGRLFDARDRFESEAVALVNQRFAEHRLGGLDVVGQQLLTGRNDQRRVTIVGVVETIAMGGDGLGDASALYRPLSQEPRDTLGLLARTSLPLETFRRTVAHRVRKIQSRATAYDFATLEQTLARQRATYRLMAALLTVFTFVALLLAGLGLYGSLDQLVRRRWREIGLRRALGASRRRIVRLVLSRTLLRMTLGLVAGAGLAYWGTRFLSTRLEHGPRWGPELVALAFVLEIVLAAMACAVPAWRATHIEPGRALRTESGQ